MQLLILWCEAQAAQRRLRDTFRDSSKPNEEPTLSPQSNEGTPGIVHYLSAKRSVLPTVQKDIPTQKKQSIKTNIILHHHYYRLLALIITAIMLSGLTSCSTADPTVRHNTTANIEIAPPSYNSESQGFEGSWPFGPEEDH